MLLLDKSTFPRDKICGDAVSGKSVSVLRRLGLIERLQQIEQIGSWGVTFGGPRGAEAEIPFTKELGRPVPPGFICARETFDQLLFDRAVESGADVRTGANVTGLLRVGERVTGVEVEIDKQAHRVEAPLVIGADGAYSVVARHLGMEQLDESHYCAGLRVYYEGVTGFNDLNHIELHFMDEAIPGYFWIFPMANGRANVGICMLSAAIKKNRTKLRDVLQACIEHPRYAERFKDARPLGPVKGWGLPLGSKPRPLSGDGWMLVGDAASLIDPFTGEGIGNAMISGERAALWTQKAHEANDFSGDFLKAYDAAVMRYLKGELQISHALQKMIRWRWLLNSVIGKASRAPEIADTISCMFDDETQRRRLLRPSFYWKVLTA